MNANDKKLTELLERWQSGDYTRADELELQRLLAESDGFARDAAEGYEAFPEENHTGRLMSLRKKIAPERDRFTLFSGRSMALAAAFVLLIVAVWWVMNPGQVSPEVAAVQPSAAPNVRTAPEIKASENALGNNSATTSPSLSDRARGGKMVPGAPPTAPGAIVSAEGTREESAGKAVAPVLDDQLKEQKDQATDKLADIKKPVPAYAPNSGSATENEPSDIVFQPQPSGGAPAKKVEVFDQNAGEIEKARSVENRDGSLSKATGKSNSAKTKQKPGKYEEAKSITRPSPAGGWDKFRSEMSRQLTLPQTAKDKGISVGTVSMTLDINAADGKIRSVLFTNRLGYGCDELAEQFVQKYNWVVMPGGSSEVEVDILFK